MKARLFAMLGTLAAALIVASGAQAGALTFSTQGSPGPWLGSYGWSGDIYCEAPDRYSTTFGRYFQLQGQEVGRSALYANLSHDVFMQARLEWSGNGYNWFTLATRPWQKQTVPPGSSNFARFAIESFDVSRYSGYYWRVRVEFRWYVAGTATWLGTAVDGFTENGITEQYGALALFLKSNGEGVCYLP